MGVCCTTVEILPSTILYRYYNEQVVISRGNPLNEKADGLVVPTNSILQLGYELLNCETIELQKKAIVYLKHHRNLTPGDIYCTNSPKCPLVIFAVCPVYVDGTLGEPDYLKAAFNNAFKQLIKENKKNIVVSLDWNYPKLKYVKTVFSVIGKFLEEKNFDKIIFFCNNTHMVKNIQVFAIRKHLEKMFGNNLT